MRRATLAAALLTTLAVTSCSSGDGGTATGKEANAKTSAPASPTAQREDGPLKLGQAHHWTGKSTDGKRVSGTVVAIAYMHPDPRIDLPAETSDYDNPDWVSLEVKGCIDKDSATTGFSQEPWALAFPDSTRIAAPLISGSGTAKPEYSVQGAVVKPGDCLRGKITFSVEHGTRPSRIIWGPTDQRPAEWVVPKA
jgi:hypothetical protein